MLEFNDIANLALQGFSAQNDAEYHIIPQAVVTFRSR